MKGIGCLGFNTINTLSDEDMAAIATLDTGKSAFFDHHAPEVVKMFMGWR